MNFGGIRESLRRAWGRAWNNACIGWAARNGGGSEAMQILVLNGGSSSIKFSGYEGGGGEPRCLMEGELSGIGTAGAKLKVGSEESSVDARTLEGAIDAVMEAVGKQGGFAPDAVGHRVVHPGAHLRGHQRVTAEVLKELEGAATFAPLHDPEALTLIRAAMRRYPEVGHYVCFDTVFHETMPEEAKAYPLPPEYGENGVRRYGFHGLSCESIVRQMQVAGKVPKRMVIAHLGSGCSVTAVVDGQSVDTTMGLTPTGGVVMGTRAGDLDPGLVLYLLREQKGPREEAVASVETLLNKDAGVAAMSGMANDVRVVRQAAAKEDARAVLALKVFTRSVTKAIGSFCWLMGGMDAIVFAGGIGEHDAGTREEILAGLEGLGVELEGGKARGADAGIQAISAPGSKIKIFIVPAQEDLIIALHVERMERSGR